MIKTGMSTAVLLLAVLLLFTATACQKKLPTTPSLRPLISETAGLTSSGTEVQLVLFGTLRLGMRQLDRATRARYLQEVTGQSEDPFLAPTPDQEDPFLIFLFTVENRGDKPALLSPSFATLTDQKGRFNVAPFDIHELSGILAVNPAFTPEVSRRIHEPTINVNPGTQHTKMLLFPALDRKSDVVEVLIPSVVSGNVTADAHFPFSVTWEPLPAF